GDEIAVAEKGIKRSIFDWPGMTN
ncbi:hypothetical protein VN97_g11541, partial [Penicillium thymicola]